MTNLPAPPAHIAPFVKVLGAEGAIGFLLTFGGAEIYWAANPKGKSRLVEAVGLEKARALAEAAEFLPRRVPTGKPWIARVWRVQGVAVAEIARRLHTSDVTVRRYLKGNPAPPYHDPRQQALF
jgi:hypothetical protein